MDRTEIFSIWLYCLKSSNMMKQWRAPVVAGRLSKCMNGIRLKSSTETALPSVSCPHGSLGPSTAATQKAAERKHHPKLVRVPTLPYIGSLLPFHSGVPSCVTDPYKFLPGCTKKFGDFYSLGLPSIGNPDDRHSTLYVIRDPNEMAKVVRGGGKYPSGLVQHMWPNKRWSMEHDVLASNDDAGDMGFFGHGEDWKRVRTFLQTDLLHPDSARGYLPGILRAAKLASNGAPHVSATMNKSTDGEELNHYFSRAAFDMFSSLMFGELTNTADISTTTDAENVEFVESTKLGLATSIQMLVDPYENIIGRIMGIKSERYHDMSKGFTHSYGIGKLKIQRFMDKKERGGLNEMEESSYLARAIDRQKEEGCDITPKEVQDIAFTQLFAAVDTTSNAVAWNVLHMALNPTAQQTLHDELRRNIDLAPSSNGDLYPSMLDRKSSPYLHSILRETHRLTPNGPIYLFKRITGAEPVAIHNERLLPGSVVALEGLSASYDPDLVDDPTLFRPERWSKDEVDRRKGTPSEIMDHPYYKDAFSQGARRCPGSRVATNETMIFLAQLVLDWKISMPEGVETLEDVQYEQRTSVEPIIPPLVFEPRS